MPSSDAHALSEWVTAVARELGLEEALDSLGTVDLVLDLTSDVAHGVSRPGAPYTLAPHMIALNAGLSSERRPFRPARSNTVGSPERISSPSQMNSTSARAEATRPAASAAPISGTLPGAATRGSGGLMCMRPRSRCGWPPASHPGTLGT